MERRDVGLFEGLKSIYNEADSQGAFDSVKEKLFNKARIDKENNNNDTESSANVSSEADTDKKNINIKIFNRQVKYPFVEYNYENNL